LPRKKQQFEAMRNATKDKIADAGLRLFAYKGLSATSIQDIARQADISIGLLYHYYKSKEDLFNELVETAIEGADQATRLIFGSDHAPAEKIQTFSQDVIEEIASGEWMSQVYLLMIHHTLELGTSRKTSKITEKGLAPLQSVEPTSAKGRRWACASPAILAK